MHLQVLKQAFVTILVASVGALAEFQDPAIYARDIAPKTLERLVKYREVHSRSLAAAQAGVLKRAEATVANFAVHDVEGLSADCEAAVCADECNLILGKRATRSSARREVFSLQIPECHCTDEHPSSDCDDGYTCRYKYLFCVFFGVFFTLLSPLFFFFFFFLLFLVF